MDLSAVLLFATVIAVATATPGPSLLTLIARVLSIGPARNIGFAIGLVLGDVLWLGAAAFGLSAIAAQAHEVMAVLKYVGTAYLLYLAYRMWTAPTGGVIASARPRRLRWGSVAGGLAMAVSNPKTMLFYLALLPNLVPLDRITAARFIELSVVLAVVYGTLLATFMFGLGYARGFIASQRAVRYANRGSAVVMAGTAAVVAARS